MATLSEPFLIAGNEIRTETSIGIAVYTPDQAEAETLMSHADVALYRAKSEERGTFRFFTDAMDANVRSRVTLNSQLRQALESDQLLLFYQPQVEIDTGRVIGLEALVRWRHPSLGLLPPQDFIAAAEKGGLILALGRWVLNEACRQIREWLDAGLNPPVMAVNFSAMQFKRPQELEKDIAAILEKYGLSANSLEIELTETSLMETSREHNDVLQRLHQAGISFAIDDFGTGYSSLDYLRRFPFNRLKIAQNFVADLATDPGNAAIVKASISLARELGLNIIAEGVETAEQLELLKVWGCHEVQGFYFAKPMSADEIAPVLRQGRIAPHGPTWS
jgi:EAL domain-containing protein (putative c-di-GMP-specific phosphodiesterase class I)